MIDLLMKIGVSCAMVGVLFMIGALLAVIWGVK